MEQNQKSWMLPPSLYQTYNEFNVLYDTLYKDPSSKRKNQPILIMGAPGVGKTLFSEVFANRCKEDNNISDDKIIRINVAAFPETLIESTLFGHMAGAFTDAKREKKGFVEDAAGGILILDEIGELSKEVQAKLLTFIEDNYYYKVGAIKPSRSKGIQIIATTNKTPEDDVFRQDFIDRFFPFYIPPLYERRQDILYHWEHFFPDLIAALAPWEVMAIMAYNWLGNVREIEKVGNLITWQMAAFKDSGRSKHWFYEHSLAHLKPGYTSLNLRLCSVLYRDLSNYGIDIRLLHRELVKYGITLTYRGGSGPSVAFSEIDKHAPERKLITVGQLNIEAVHVCKEFEKVYDGVNLICSLLKRNIDHNNNLFELADGHFDIHARPPSDFFKKYTNTREKLVHGITSFIEEKYLSKIETVSPSDIFKMTEKELLCHYLKGILKIAHGNQSKAAKIAKIPLSTFRDHCKKCGI